VAEAGSIPAAIEVVHQFSHLERKEKKNLCFSAITTAAIEVIHQFSHLKKVFQT